MEVQQLLQIRRQKGYEIANKKKIVLKHGTWFVPSQNHPHKIYKVILGLSKSTCTCEDFIERGLRCKHQFAVEYVISRKVNQDGSITITETKRITYPQNWKAYNAAQIKEKELFMKLLNDLCNTIEEPEYTFGRPKMLLKDMTFSSALKVYTTFSLRRFGTDIKMAKELNYVEKVPYYSTVSRYMQDEKLTAVIQELIVLSSLPLRSVETKFAVDSSGFRTTRFSEYCREKHSIAMEHEWIKAHICCGVKTNVITAVEIDSGYSADVNKFISLVDTTHKSGFNVEEVSGDKAYSSRNNLAFVDSIGGMPFIPFKNNATGKRRGDGGHIWKNMYNFFTYRREEFAQHYHARSNVETTFFMIKAKFTDYIRSKDETAQVNELLLKILCHNIVVLIQEMFELGIKPEFLGV